MEAEWPLAGQRKGSCLREGPALAFPPRPIQVLSEVLLKSV